MNEILKGLYDRKRNFKGTVYMIINKILKGLYEHKRNFKRTVNCMIKYVIFNGTV